MDVDDSLIGGPDRVGRWERAGRAIRCGSPQAFETSDIDRLDMLMRAGRTAEALELLGVLRPLYLDMNRILLEWCLAYSQACANKKGKAEATRLNSEVVAAWREICGREASQASRESTALLGRLFLDHLAAGEEAVATAIAAVNAIPDRILSAVVEALEKGRLEDASAAFTRFVELSRSRHDLLCLFLWVYPTVLMKRHGQAFSEAVMDESFQSCSSYKAFFALMDKLPPPEVAAFVAEHLRGHYSGAGRRGQVSVVEEEDRYRLVFDPCGSGGAMRRSVAGGSVPGLENYPDASAATWGRSGEVPTYCAHCAQNEMAMIKRFGFPGWVVEFDPDPMRPCGWTVFKDPAAIPDHYFERVGMTKDRARIESWMRRLETPT